MPSSASDVCSYDQIGIFVFSSRRRHTRCSRDWNSDVCSSDLGWLPAIIWLILGVSFLGWASDYSGIVISVRNDGNSLSAIAHRLVSPRTRTILFVFIFFYLLLVAGAFVGIMATVLESQPKTQLGAIVLTVLGLLLGQMLYRWRTGLVGATVLTVGLTL